MDRIPLEERPIFEDKGRTFELIMFDKPTNKMLVWEQMKIVANEHHEEMKVIKADILSVETLRKINIWDSLSDDSRKGIEGKRLENKEVLVQRLEIARRSKRQKYGDNVPTELVCIQCGAKIDINQGVLCKRVEDKKMILADYVKNYKCQKCSPSRRGRRRKI